MGVVLSIVAIAVLVAAYLWVRQRPSQSDARPAMSGNAAADTGTQFHAVSIKFEDNACNAAKELEGKRFLSSAAPRIPLPECDVLECKCRFVHHKDRRQSEDRRNPYRGSIDANSGEFAREKRIRGDRRSDEPPDFFS